MQFKDYYKIMGVSENANIAEIKVAYRKLAKKYHPDVSEEKDAENKFKEVGEAYEVLKDKKKRQAYDHMRQNGYRDGDSFTPPTDWFSDESLRGTFHDFFSSVFNDEDKTHEFFKNTTSTHKHPGADVVTCIAISLEKAYSGGEETFRIEIHGHIRKIKYTIPPGIKEGQRIRLKGQGEPGMDGPGDLFVEISFKKHPLFTLKGNDVFLSLPLTPWEAALGAKIEVPTLAGTVKMNIPKNSQTGDKLRLVKRGLPGTPNGNQYVLVQIINPMVTNEIEEEAFKTLKKQCDFNPRRHLPGF